MNGRNVDKFYKTDRKNFIKLINVSFNKNLIIFKRKRVNLFQDKTATSNYHINNDTFFQLQD